MYSGRIAKMFRLGGAVLLLFLVFSAVDSRIR